MKIMTQMMHLDLINLVETAPDRITLLRKLSQKLIQKGYVKDSFEAALLEREKEFPTGLQLENTAVAIPHTYAEHVLKPFIFFNKLATPISFVQMGTDDVLVNAEFILVLGISDPKQQTGLLVELMELFSDTVFLTNLKQAKSEEEIYHLCRN